MEQLASSSANDSYVLARGDCACGTHRIEEVLLAPAAIVRCFGNGDPGDEYKVSRQYVFRKGDLIFTLYDWKSTDLYEPGLFSPKEFWTLNEAMDLHVGSQEPATRQDVTQFLEWLLRVTSELT